MSNQFIYKVQVRYPDFDTQLFVNHSKICTYIESAYVSFFVDQIKAGWNYANLPILLKEEKTLFLKPITPTSPPICRLSVNEIRPKGVKLQIEIYDQEDKSKIYAIAERILIHVDLATVTPIHFPTEISNKLNAILSDG
jgi:acyl-CoA thioesterase FadM